MYLDEITAIPTQHIAYITYHKYFSCHFSSVSEPPAEIAQLWIIDVFQKLFNALKLIEDLWELNDSHIYHSPKYQLPIANQLFQQWGTFR